ncbi:glyoxylase-like metal-dependent hydrolase (beta-lactamase superfamily II) [Actinoplanes italicus]|uniref:Glyoxylase-like metal-dependent hydrolase (Beta-lactamase superfamily II) n=2 Tax=Actinoplanes italicus TaxID=113567 RepID=A0A2T0KK64_9ACTN|nr:MBL fold metallo-hydrolase [Actinoplanes italicus]PRX23920.1 glyoxylase-like metal-dependent hydrolase (beta-lactamase superfamily II) [Actinoplanes italicus]
MSVPEIHDLGGGLTMTKVSVGPMDNNAYLLSAGGEQLLIDAANDAGTLLDLIGDTGLRTVVTTHRHGDHWQALAEVVRVTGAESLAHADDAAEIPVVTRTLHDGDTIEVGGHSLDVIHVVGHTPGSIVLAYRGAHLFTGDSLFPGGVGNTRGVKENFESLIGDVERKLFGRFGDDTWFYPGHGKDSTLGAERPHLAEWRERGW